MNPIGDRTRPALAPGVRLHNDKTTGDPVLLFPEGLLQLNATAHAIVSRCDGRSTTEAIVSALAAEFDAGDLAALRNDVLDCLGELRKHKLVVFST